jgi:hypothetical protein
MATSTANQVTHSSKPIETDRQGELPPAEKGFRTAPEFERGEAGPRFDIGHVD